MPSRTLVPLGLLALILVSVLAHGAPLDRKAFSNPYDAEAASPVYALHARPTPFAPRGSIRGAAVPAYGINLNPTQGNTFVFFDAADPGVLEVIAPTSRTLVGGAFVNNDFSRFYTIDYDLGVLLYLDTSDGSETIVGDTGLGGPAWFGLAADPDTGILYGVAAPPNLGGVSTLFVIDITTGLATLIGNIGDDRIADIAIRHTPGLGSLAFFAVDIDHDTLIDASGGTIGFLGFNAEFAAGLDFDQTSGILYFAAINDMSPFNEPDQMFVLDTTTGHATLVGDISPDPTTAQISAFATATIPAGCGLPEDIPWLSFAPNAGTTAPGETGDVTVTLDATGLASGVYTATLCVTSNDPGHRLIAVPVEMTVQ